MATVIRHALVADAPGIARVHWDSHQTTYRPDLDREAPGRVDRERVEAWTMVIYVLEGHHGTGVGQALVDAAIGDRPAYLWALDDNPRAHAFYRRNGFELDGAEQFDELWQVTEVRFVR